MAHRSRAASLRRTSQSAAASRARSVPSASSCRTVVRSRVTFFIGHCRSTRTPCLKDRHGESKIQRTYRRSTPKAHRKKTCRARPWPRICSALKNRHPRSGPSRRLSRSTSSLLKNPRQNESSLIQFFYHESVEARMRGAFVDQGQLFSYISPEARVAANHPLRAIRALVRDVLSALLLQVFYGIRSERQLMEQLDPTCCSRARSLAPSPPVRRHKRSRSSSSRPTTRLHWGLRAPSPSPVAM